MYDEEKQEWLPKWGYRGKNKEVENQWLVEIDDKKTKHGGEEDGEANPRKLNRDERKRRVKLNERQQKKNAQQGRRGGAAAALLGPRGGSGVAKRRR